MRNVHFQTNIKAICSILNLKNLKLIFRVTSIIVILFLTSCEDDYTVKHEKVSDIDFKKLKTYAWLPVTDSISVGGIDQYQLNNAIISNIDDQLFRAYFLREKFDPQAGGAFYTRNRPNVRNRGDRLQFTWIVDRIARSVPTRKTLTTAGQES